MSIYAYGKFSVSMPESRIWFNLYIFEMKKSTVPSSKKVENEKRMMLSRLADDKKNGMSAELIFAKLADSDDHGRYQKSALNIGNAVIKETSPGVFEFSQYSIAQLPDVKTSLVRVMKEIKRVTTAKGMSWYRAVDTEGRKYVSNRYVNLDSRRQGEVQIRFFEEYDYSSDESEFSDSDIEPIPLLREELTTEERDSISRIQPKIKSGRLRLNPDHVRRRDENPVRTETQNNVIGQSAKAAYEDLLLEMKNLLSPKLILILQRAIGASLYLSPEKYFRPEWLHRIGHALSLISEKKEDNPQQRSNLGAAGAWANTEMMLLERLAKWFCLSEDNAEVTINPIFEMLYGSELIHKIHFEVDIDVRGEFVRFIQDIDVFKEYPTFPKTSDFAQTAMIVDNIFSKTSPILTDRVGSIFKKHKADARQSEATLTEAIVSENASEAKALRILSSLPEYWICRRIQDTFPSVTPSEPFHKIIIIDTETSGLDPAQDELIELAMVCCAFSKKTKRFLGVIGTYEGLNQPKVPISADITRITGITNEQLEGQKIDWDLVSEMLRKTKYVVCHNVRFDRAFLENQAPEPIANQFKVMQFACTLEHIDWYRRGFDLRKLDFLNFKLGYFYEAHRALSDCFATLNILRHVPGAYDELLYNAHKIHMYHFSARLMGSERRAASLPAVDLMRSSEQIPTQKEIDEADALISSLPQSYRIYRAIEKQNVIFSPINQASPIFTVIALRTTGNNTSTDQITGISLLSFSKPGEEFLVHNAFSSMATLGQGIDWEKVSEALKSSSYLLSHNSIHRKFLESAATPPRVRAKVKSLPFGSTSLDIDWKKWKAANNTLKYLSFVFGYYFDPDCLESQSYATLNLLKMADGAYNEFKTNIKKAQMVILLNGPLFSEMKAELKNKGFQWSDGSGQMGRGWCATLLSEEATQLIEWLLVKKEGSTDKNDIRYRMVLPVDRYSVRAEFKAVEMSLKVSPKKRLREDNEADATLTCVK